MTPKRVRVPARLLLIVSGGALVLAAAGLLLLGFGSPRTSQGTGTFSLDGMVAAVNISFKSACSPGNLATPANPNVQPGIPNTDLGAGRIVPLTGTVYGCISRAGCPETLIIGRELFNYANVSALTTAIIPPSGWSLPTYLAAVNLPAPPPSLGSSCAPQTDLPNNFPNSGYIYVDQELLHYSSLDAGGFNIDGRAQNSTIAASHVAGSLVRAEGQLNLLKRSVPKYISTPYLVGQTATSTPTPRSYAPGQTVDSPKVYLTCRDLLSQAGGGTNPVSAVSRCYFIDQPGYDETNCLVTPAPAPAPAACFWPNGPLPPDAVQKWSVAYWQGSLVDHGSYATVSLAAQVNNGYCFEYLHGLLWGIMSAQINMDKGAKAYTGGTGNFMINLYTDSTCQTGLLPLVDAFPNVAVTPMPTPGTSYSSASDSDGDGCPDVKELGTDRTLGGLRDPFNRYDYPDMPVLDGKIRINDVSYVIARYRHDLGGVVSPLYDPRADHTALGPNSWNLGPGDGQIRINDVSAVINQYRNDC